MAIRALVFDLFDTLVDLHMDSLPEFRLGDRVLRGTHAALHQVAREHVSLEFEPFVVALRDSDRALWRETYEKGRELPTLERFRAFGSAIGAERAEELAQALCDTHMSAIRGQAKTVAEHRPVLQELGQRFQLGLCSNFSHTPTALAVLDDANLRDVLGPIVISEGQGFRKPRPEIFHEILDALGAQSHEVVHVGDRLDADITGAAALGIGTVWITRRVRDPERQLANHTGPPPDRTITHLKQLLQGNLGTVLKR